MQTKMIQCPNCGAVLDVKNSNDEAVKQIRCPNCRKTLQVKFQQALEAHTFLGPNAGGIDGGTQYGGGIDGRTQLANPTSKECANAWLVLDGKDYPLKEGKNIVGRRGNSSEATVQLDTSDRYLSRQHCQIIITRLPDGTIKAVLSNYKNKNRTTVNNQLIEEGDEIRLADGYTITMGHTTVIFKLS